ncbi:MAG: integrase arm-type DNA-binding domain-containing protein [Parasphingorhabdus sp.]
MPLTDKQIKAARHGESKSKLFDGGGLFLQLTSSGSKLWRMKYRADGKEKLLSFGRYPEVSLKDARGKRDEAKLQRNKGIDPAAQKREKKLQARIGSQNSFRVIGEDYLEKISKEGLSEATISKSKWLFGKLVSSLGSRPIKEIDPPELLSVLKKEEQKGNRETARRMRSFSGRVFRYAIATGRADADPTFALRGALLTPQVKHLAAITDSKRFAELLRAIDGYTGHPATTMALRLTPHIFQRPGEIRKMQWTEIDFEKAVWTIDVGKMKNRKHHAIPLSRQSLALIEEMREFSSHSSYVFPALGKPKNPMSNNAVVGALRRLGFSGDEMTAHGFRTTASTLLNESGKWNPDAIERALSHADKNQVRAIYNRSAYWNERVKMAQWWSDYLEVLKSESPHV